MRLYVALVHFPVYNKHKERIASAITTVDVHDFARLSSTYGIRRFFVITPLKDQQTLVHRILKHWSKGHGATYNPDRKKAFERVDVTPSLASALKTVSDLEGLSPVLVATDASQLEYKGLTFDGLGRLISSQQPVLLLFGTAWGLHQEIMQEMDYVLEPVWGTTDYNHLSVRTAAAIILDRLVGSLDRPACPRQRR